MKKLRYLTRIHYKDQGDGRYGEHEIDYIIFVQHDVHLSPNSSEVSEIKYLNKQDFKRFVEKNRNQLTPWFDLILKHDFELWWDNLNNLEQFENHQTISKLNV